MRLRPRSYILVFILTAAICTNGFSQLLTPEVVSSAGDFFVSTQGSLSWTLGEIADETFETSDGIFTSGFQQPSSDLVTGLKEDPEFQISPYPNPTTENMTLLINQQGNYVIDIYDLKGILLLNEKVDVITESYRHPLKTENYAPALYLLKVTDVTTGRTFMYRIEKLNKI